MRRIRFRGAHRFWIVSILAIGATGHGAGAQQPYPPQNYPVYPQPSLPQQYPASTPLGSAGTQQGQLPSYRSPTITLAAPAEGIALPEDKPVAVLRFMSGEPLDPIDALSFSVVVDGHDRTALFQLSQGEAWGSLAAQEESLAAGQHEVIARICTAHGACGTTKSTVTVVAATSLGQLAAPKSVAKAKEKKNKVLDAVIQAARALIR